MPELFYFRSDATFRRETQFPLSILAAAHDFRFQIPLEDDALPGSHLPPRPHQRFPRQLVARYRPQQKNFHAPRQVLPPLGIVFPHRQRMNSGAMPEQPRWKYFGIVQYQAIARAQELRKLAKGAVFPTPFLAIQDQHSRSRAVRQRLLRDGRFRQLVIEFRQIQRHSGHTIRIVRILGIESSCDETAAAVVADDSAQVRPRLLSSVVASQLATHSKYGGVVPELASREHLRAIVPVVRAALEEAGASWDDISAIAVTQGPGLAGSLLVGITYAKSICFARGIPLIAVNHIEGHIHAVVLETGERIAYPALALVVSGGHTHLFEVREGFSYRLLGKTRDDAAGEAFDKVAKLLGFGYPGGPIVDQLAVHGDPRGIKFTSAKMKGNALDFSFSGLKTAVLRWVEQRDMGSEIEARRKLVDPTTEDYLRATPQPTLDLLASFQKTVIDELLKRSIAAAEEIGARSMIISGGVACNTGLRHAANAATLPYPVFFPTPGLSTDNAAMIAAAAIPKYKRAEFADFDLRAQPNLALA